MVVGDVIETGGDVRGVEAMAYPGLVRDPLPRPLP